jgi:hypothetical protein
MKKYMVSIVAGVMVVSFTACTPEKIDSLTEDASGVVVEEIPDGIVVDADTTDTENVLPVGKVATVGDWDVDVIKVVKNADNIIQQTNQFNDRAKGQYVLVTVDAKYNGPAKSDVSSDLSFYFLDNKNTIHNESYQVTPFDSSGEPTEARKGGKVSVQVLFDVPPSKFKGGRIGIEDWISSQDYIEFQL